MGLSVRLFAAAAVVVALTGSSCPGPRPNFNNFIAEKAEDDKYQAVVTLPDGKPVVGAVICLDYDPVLTYEPAKFRTGPDGKVSIPHRYAEAVGWEHLWVSLQADGRYFYRRFDRPEVRWPQKVKLEEVRR